MGTGFNRDYWARFEKFVKDVANKSDEVYVVTGPLFLPQLDEQDKWVMKHSFIGELKLENAFLVQSPAPVHSIIHYFRQGLHIERRLQFRLLPCRSAAEPCFCADALLQGHPRRFAQRPERSAASGCRSLRHAQCAH